MRWLAPIASMPVSGKAVIEATVHEQIQNPYRCPAFFHETVTFLKNDTTLDDFIYSGLAGQRPGAAGGVSKILHGWLCEDGARVRRRRAGRHRIAAMAETGTGSGWITEQAFETFTGKMIAGLKAEAAFDGVYLCLHGAMAVRGVPRPEAELARRVREAAGPKTFIAATFDLHGNEDEAFLTYADMAFAVKYFPHYDEYLQGERAARTLLRAIRGDYKPTHITIRVPVISPGCCSGPARRHGWIWGSALGVEAREPDTYVKSSSAFRSPTCPMSA